MTEYYIIHFYKHNAYITVQKSLFPKLGYLHDANLPHTNVNDITSVELALVMQTHTSGTSKWRSALRVLSGWQYI